LDWLQHFKVALDTAKGLPFLHEAGILYRDIKSLNVLLDEQYKAKRTDFGLSTVKTETKSHTMTT
jgi:serine/threonine protein kinase